MSPSTKLPVEAAPGARSLRSPVVAESLALLYVAFVAAAAARTGLQYLLFPELAALAHDVLKRPTGRWARQPARLVATPVLTAAIGTLVTRHLPYHVLTILLIVAASLLLIALLRSAIAPAISAGVLPLVFGVTSWLYPLAILFGLAVLAGLLVAWRELLSPPPEDDAGPPVDVDEILESPSRTYRSLVPLALFVTVAGWAAQRTGLRFILFPPLIVMAHEMFGHPETCPWARRPFSFPVACFLTAAGGLAAASLLGSGPAAAAVSTAWGIAVLRGFDVHMPPALAVGLIPLVMEAPSWKYPLSVAVGTAGLTGLFLAWRRVSAPLAAVPPTT